MERLNETKITSIKEALKPFSLKFAGGSMETNSKKAWVFLEHGSEATYNNQRVANVLSGILGVNSIVLDGVQISLVKAR